MTQRDTERLQRDIERLQRDTDQPQRETQRLQRDIERPKETERPQKDKIDYKQHACIVQSGGLAPM